MEKFIRKFGLVGKETLRGSFGGDSVSLSLDLPSGFSERPEWADGGFRKVWTSDRHYAIITYCEGDISLVQFPGAFPFDKHIEYLTDYYKEF